MLHWHGLDESHTTGHLVVEKTNHYHFYHQPVLIIIHLSHYVIDNRVSYSTIYDYVYSWSHLNHVRLKVDFDFLISESLVWQTRWEATNHHSSYKAFQQ